jgi:tetratricopeptide (TPR) repeat protein
MSGTQKPLHVLLLFANEDEVWRTVLLKHLSSLMSEGRISVFDSHQIVPGTDRVAVLEQHLRGASVILLLVSAACLASHDREIEQALHREMAGKVLIIPILLHPVDWHNSKLSHLQPLPGSGRPVTMWSSPEAAFVEVVVGIRKALSTIEHRATHAPSATFPSIWNIPYPRNPLFTGRNELLKKLSIGRKPGQAQAISGLAGIGKTQIAVEYVYRYGHEYECVFWLRAATYDLLVSDFVIIADLVQLPERNEQDQQVVIESVKQWLALHGKWLLIFDNVDDIKLVSQFLPAKSNGHVLLTTQAQALSKIARKVAVDVMTPEEGALFLLRRANIIEPDTQLSSVDETDHAQARAISELLGNLPLALDQAGAYIEETASSLSDYITLYNTERAQLLKERGGFALDHPESVVTTWQLSFEKISATNPAAGDLLRFLAFLSPDAIPEEIITEGASELGPTLQSVASNIFSLNAVLRELLGYSLIRRNPNTKTLAIHRLVQAVLKDEMDEPTQRLWAERVLRTVNRTFPNSEFATWRRCQRCLPHAQVCADLIDRWTLEFLEAARLLHQTGRYLYERGQYSEAEPLYQRALTIRERIWGPTHPDVAASLHDLAVLYYEQGKYPEADPLYQRAATIQEQALGSQHPDFAKTVNRLGDLYRAQGISAQAEQFYQRALSIREQVLGPAHPDVARSLEDLAILYCDQGKYQQAEPLYQRALAIREQAFGPLHPDSAATLNDLALLYDEQKNYAQAEPLYQRALATREQIFGPSHPEVATSLNNLAGLYIHQSHYEQATPLLERALAMYEAVFGTQHPRVANSQTNLANLYYHQGKYEQAEPLLQRALLTREQLLGPQHPDLAHTLINLAYLYSAQGKSSEAESLYQRALAIREVALGETHPLVIRNICSLADLYSNEGKYAQAELLYQRALALGKQALGPQHADYIRMQEKYANLLRQENREE